MPPLIRRPCFRLCFIWAFRLLNVWLNADYDVIKICLENNTEAILPIPPLSMPISSHPPIPPSHSSPPTMYNHPGSQRQPSSTTPLSNSRDNDPRDTYGYGSTQERRLSFDGVGESDRDIFGAGGVYGRERSLRQVRISIYFANRWWQCSPSHRLIPSTPRPSTTHRSLAWTHIAEIGWQDR